MSKMRSETHRLHTSSLLFGLGPAAKRLLIPGIIALVALRSSSVEIWLMLLFVPSAIASFIRYFSYRYRFGSDDLLDIPSNLFRKIRILLAELCKSKDTAQRFVKLMSNTGGELTNCGQTIRMPQLFLKVLSFMCCSILLRN